MSVNSKPHQSEPLAVIEDDGLGGKIIRPTDAWYQYFNSVDTEVNTTINQTVTNIAYSQSNSQMVDRSLISQHADQLSELNRHVAQLKLEVIALKRKEELKRIEGEMFSLRGMIRAATRASKNLQNPVLATPVQYLLRKIESALPCNKGVVFVDSANDLPHPVSGVHTLKDRVTYWVTNDLDLKGARLVGGQSTVILGSSSENSSIKSTGLTGVALITSEWTLPIRHIALEAEQIFDLDATANANQALDWYGVNFRNTSNIGTIQGYTNFIGTGMALLSASGMVFDGTTGTIGFEKCLFSGNASSTILTIPSTATIERRIRISYSAVIVPATGVGFDVSTSASIPIEGSIFDTCNFSGTGTYTAGITYDDNKARWTENRGIKNSAAFAGYYMRANTTATVIASIGTPVKVAGTTTAYGTIERFTHSDNRVTYVGAIPRTFLVLTTNSASSGNGDQVGFYVAKNGVTIDESETYITTNASGRLENGVCFAIVELSTNDYIEIFVENNDATNNVTDEYMNTVLVPIN